MGFGAKAVLRRAAGIVFDHLIRPPYRAIRGVGAALIDKRLNVATANKHLALLLKSDCYLETSYQTLGWSKYRRLLRYLPSGDKDVFLDIGCGAGRMVCAAAIENYARVIGVELDTRLAALAEINAANLRGRRSTCEILCADACSYDIPKDVTVIFMYNPFGGEVLRATLGNILKSYDLRPRPLLIAYVNPKEHAAFLSSGRFRPLKRIHLAWRPSDDWKRSQAVQFYDVTSPGDHAGRIAAPLSQLGTFSMTPAA